MAAFGPAPSHQLTLRAGAGELTYADGGVLQYILGQCADVSHMISSRGPRMPPQNLQVGFQDGGLQEGSKCSASALSPGANGCWYSTRLRAQSPSYVLHSSVEAAKSAHLPETEPSSCIKPLPAVLAAQLWSPLTNSGSHPWASKLVAIHTLCPELAAAACLCVADDADADAERPWTPVHDGPQPPGEPPCL